MTTKRTLRMKYGTACFRNMTYARHYYARQHHSLAIALEHGGCAIGTPTLLHDETYEWNEEGRAIVSVWNMPVDAPVIIAPWQLPEAVALRVEHAMLRDDWKDIVDRKNADRG